MSAEISVFEIDWSDIQVNAFVGSLVGIANGGRAKSDGVEWNFGYVPLRGLKLNLNGAYTDARLEDSLPPPTVAAAGRALPDVPRWSTSVSADYEHGLLSGYEWFGGVNWRYVDARPQEFPSGPEYQPLMPAYHMVNLKAGIESNRWTVTAYVKNVGNTMAMSTVTPISGGTNASAVTATVLPPRTVGVTLSVKY